MVPICEIEENQETVPALTSSAVPTINPDSLMPQVIEAFLACHVPNRKTARGYRRHITAAMDMMAVEKFSELRPIHLMNYKSELMVGPRGMATKAQALIALRAFLKWGAALGGHTLNMVQVEYLLPVPKVTVITPHEIMTDKEIASYLATARREGKREYALAIVALGSGVRIAELVHLDIQDIRFDGAGTVIHVRQGKGSKDRMIPVRKEIRKAVDAYLESTGRKPSDIGCLFQSADHAMADRDSWRLSTKTASKIIKALAEKAGITKRITPHALRHTFAAATFTHCRNVMIVSKLLGHSSINTTYRYINHLMDSDMRNATPAYLVGAKGPRVSPSLKQHKQAA
jgi:site-specific recombinase XerD